MIYGDINIKCDSCGTYHTASMVNLKHAFSSRIKAGETIEKAIDMAQINTSISYNHVRLSIQEFRELNTKSLPKEKRLKVDLSHIEHCVDLCGNCGKRFLGDKFLLFVAKTKHNMGLLVRLNGFDGKLVDKLLPNKTERRKNDRKKKIADMVNDVDLKCALGVDE